MTRIATLVGVATALLCAFAAPLFPPYADVSAGGPCSVADASNDSEELSFLATINGYRAQRGLAQLALSGTLNRAAEWQARDMIANNYFAHTDSTGRSPFVRTVDCGYPIAGGENLAGGANRGTASSAFELFRGSPSHNSNMLAPEYREIGIARVFGEGSRYGWYWATTFGAAGTAAQPPPPPPSAGAAPVAASSVPDGPQTVELYPGTQLVAWTGPDGAASVVLTAEGVVAVWDVESGEGAWESPIAGVPDFLNTLVTIREGSSIQVIATAPGQLVIPR